MSISNLPTTAPKGIQFPPVNRVPNKWRDLIYLLRFSIASPAPTFRHLVDDSFLNTFAGQVHMGSTNGASDEPHFIRCKLQLTASVPLTRW